MDLYPDNLTLLFDVILPSHQIDEGLYIFIKSVFGAGCVGRGRSKSGKGIVGAYQCTQKSIRIRLEGLMIGEQFAIVTEK